MILGLDRIPEVRCLREKIREIIDRKKAEELNHALSQSWIEADDVGIFSVDGHVRTYHGKQARLPKKYVSRQKLCLAGTTDYWVNNSHGLPYIVATGELNEKLKDCIETQIVGALLQDTQGRVDEAALQANPQLERMTIVFDREAYDGGFFKRLWHEHRIAVITYRKNVKDRWDEKEFKPYTTTVIHKAVTMSLAMRESQIQGCDVREIRKLTEGGHQTAIITTHKTASIEEIAGRMFSRWSQENFFQYMMHNDGYDKLTQYGVEEVDPSMKVVNPLYKKCSTELRQVRAKASRVKAQLYAVMAKNLDKAIDAEQVVVQSPLQQTGQSLETAIASLLQERKTLPYYISVGDMVADERFNKLTSESTLFMNVIRMIVYRAETAVTTLVSQTYARAAEEGRMLVKEIIKSDADLKADYENSTLTVCLHSLSTPRANRAVRSLCTLLNDTETVYPGTTLLMRFETLAVDHEQTNSESISIGNSGAETGMEKITTC